MLTRARVRPGRGLEWLVAGWDYFLRMPRQAVLLSAILLGATLLAALLGSLRIASVLFSVLAIIYLAALSASCRALDEHEPLPSRASPLYRSTPLWILGGIAGAVTLLLDLLSNSMGVYATAGHFGLLGLSFILIKLLSLTAMLALWLAPALVIFHGLGPLQAMKLSLLGTLSNFVPWLLFAVLAFVFCIVAAIPVGLGLLAAMPVLACGTYLASRDIVS